jgi:outer membrane protein assembly factor BamA
MAIALRVCVIVLAGASVVAPAIAQERRADEIAAAQAEKATRLAPRTPSRAERALLTAQKALIESPEGIYPYFGSVLSGGGFTLGAGYRQFLGDRTNWNVAGLYSLSNYKLIELGVTAPGLARSRLDVLTRVGWRDATQVAFYGLGPDSPADQRSNYRMQQAYAGGEVLARPLSWMRFTAGLTYEDFTLKQGTGSSPSIEEVHTPASAPGLGDNVTYLHAVASAGVDSRPAAGYARRGGLYELAYHRYVDTEETYNFDRLDAEAVQHIPILRENWVVSLRGRLQTTVGDEDQVPYFLLPSLGSGSTLRGYSSWRFRDRHSLLLSGEWRWIPNRLGLDMAFFYDAGKVTARLADINLDKLTSNVGIGVRFHGPATTPLRIEVARGTEGLHVVFAASPAF